MERLYLFSENHSTGSWGPLGIAVLLLLGVSLLDSIRRRWRGSQVLSHVWLFVTPWTVAHQALMFMGFSRQECWSGLLFLPAGDRPTQRLNLSPLCLLHCRRILYPLSHQGSHEEVSKSLEIRQISHISNSWRGHHNAFCKRMVKSGQTSNNRIGSIYRINRLVLAKASLPIIHILVSLREMCFYQGVSPTAEKVVLSPEALSSYHHHHLT